MTAVSETIKNYPKSQNNLERFVGKISNETRKTWSQRGQLLLIRKTRTFEEAILFLLQLNVDMHKVIEFEDYKIDVLTIKVRFSNEKKMRQMEKKSELTFQMKQIA